MRKSEKKAYNESIEGKHILCPFGFTHQPNSETYFSIEESEKGIGIQSFESMDDLYENLGI